MVFSADRALRPVDIADIERRAMLVPHVIGVAPGRTDTLVEVAYNAAELNPELLRLQLESPYLRLAGKDPLGERLAAAFAPRRIGRTISLLAHAPNRIAIGFVAATLILLLVGVVVERLSFDAALPIWALAFFTGGWFALRTTIGSLRHGSLDVDLLMLIAASACTARRREPMSARSPTFIATCVSALRWISSAARWS
jgi:Cd2+/Zn2+-exporting ATPase